MRQGGTRLLWVGADSCLFGSPGTWCLDWDLPRGSAFLPGVKLQRREGLGQPALGPQGAGSGGSCSVWSSVSSSVERGRNARRLLRQRDRESEAPGRRCPVPRPLLSAPHWSPVPGGPRAPAPGLFGGLGALGPVCPLPTGPPHAPVTTSLPLRSLPGSSVAGQRGCFCRGWLPLPAAAAPPVGWGELLGPVWCWRRWSPSSDASVWDRTKGEVDSGYTGIG